MHSAEERATRKTRVEAATTALRDSSKLSGPHVPAARAALKDYLRRLNEPNQPSDATFQVLLGAPFAQPPRRP
jgi:predicted kinase